MRFVGLDVHVATTSVCMRDSAGRILHETVIPTTAPALRRYVRVHRGPLAVVLEEGSLASWVYQVLAGSVAKLVVCNPRHNRLLHSGLKNDRVDAAKLAELLRLGAVQHDTQPVAIRELVLHYDVLVTDVMRARRVDIRAERPPHRWTGRAHEFAASSALVAAAPYRVRESAD